MFHRSILASAVVALAVLVAPLAVLAGTTLPAGSGLNGSLRNSLDTKSSYAGQPISITVEGPFPQGVSALGGATVYGHVGQVTPGGRGTNPQLSIVLDSIQFANGHKTHVYGAVTKLNPVQDKKHRRLIATAGGMALGNWGGKALFGGNAGGAVGAATGFLLSSNNKSDFHVPSGSAVGMQLSRSLSVP